MAQSGSRFHASRNDRTASAFAKAYIIWTPWLKNSWASGFDVEIGRANDPSPTVYSLIGASYRCWVGEVISCCAASVGTRTHAATTVREPNSFWGIRRSYPPSLCELRRGWQAPFE